MRILHTADFHVGCKTHGKRASDTGLNSRLHDAISRIEEIADLSKEADLALFAGDGFEHPNPTPTQQRHFLDAIKKFDCPIIATTGNHDVPATEGRSHALDLLNEVEGIYLIDEPGVWTISLFPKRGDSIDIDVVPASSSLPPQSDVQFVLTVLPWPLDHQAPGEMSIKQHYLNLLEEGYDKAQQLDIPAYCMGHFTISGSLPSGSEESLQLNGEVTFSPADFDGYDYVALGHIHQRQSLGEDPPVVYPSCPMRKSFSEEGDQKGAVVFDLNAPANRSFHEVDARPFRTIEADLRQSKTDLTATEQLAQITEEADTESAIVRVRYQAPEEEPVDEREVERALSDAHNVAAIERTIERDRQSRTEDGADPDASLEELIGQFAESRGLEDIEEDLTRLTGELKERV